MDMLTKLVLLRAAGFLLWILLSAWVFHEVEYTEKNEAEEKYRLLVSLYVFMNSKCNVSTEEFDNFTKQAHEALSEPKPEWTYVASFDFVFQALTTIGYGYITPQTPSGQVLCIFVCFIGIPMTLLMLKSIGELISRSVETIVTKVEKRLLKREEPKHVKTKSAIILFSIMTMILLSYTMMLNIVISWTYVEGIYFWFVTFTTIGFGDYIPHRQEMATPSLNSKNSPNNESLNTPSMFFIGITYYTSTLIGLCIVSSVLDSIVKVLEERRLRPRCSTCVPRKNKNHVGSDKCDIPDKEEAENTFIELENYGLQKEISQ